MGVATPRSTTSSIPLVMLPAPSAAKLPVRARYAPPVSSPLIENAYWPFKLLKVKPPVGGGGGMVEPPPPPQAARVTAEARVASQERRFTAHLPAACFRRCSLAPRSALGCRARCARPALACPSALCAPGKARYFRRPRFHR